MHPLRLKAVADVGHWDCIYLLLYDWVTQMPELIDLIPCPKEDVAAGGRAAPRRG